METAGFRMDEQLSEDAEDEIDEEEMEAMLYSQIHYNNDNDHGMIDIPSVFGAVHTFLVTSVDVKHESVGFWEESRVNSVSGCFSHSDAEDLSSINRLMPSKGKALFDEQKGSKSHENTSASDLQQCVALDTGEFDHDKLTKSNRRARESVSSSLKKAESGVQKNKHKASSQTQSTDFIVCGESGPASEKPQSKPKFDIEAELGINKSTSSRKSQSKAANVIDTITVESKRKTPKRSRSLTKPPALELDFIRLDGQKSKSKSEQDYTKLLKRLVSSHSVSKEVKQTMVIDSDSSSVTSSGSSEPASSSGSESSDSESDAELSSSCTRPETSRPSGTPELDLNWNVNSSDRQTIQLVERYMQQVNDSKWKIDDADMNLVKGPHVSRYYAKKEIRCHNCSKEGHLSRDCSEPKKRPNCGLCGKVGHTLNRCTNQLCFNCSLPGHKGFKCPAPKRDRFAKCARCLMKGHSEDQCPDLWRQYHLTVNSEEVVQTKNARNPRIYCCNCAKRGHFAYECRRVRPDRLVFPAYPFVVRYDKAISANRGKPGGKSQGSGFHKNRSSDVGMDHAPLHKQFSSSHPNHAHIPEQSSSDQPLYALSAQSSQAYSFSRPQRYYESSLSNQPMTHQQSQRSGRLKKQSSDTRLDHTLHHQRSRYSRPPDTYTQSTSDQALYPRGSHRPPRPQRFHDSPHWSEVVSHQHYQESSKPHQSPHRLSGEPPSSDYATTQGSLTGASEVRPLSRFAQNFMGRKVQAESSATQQGTAKKTGRWQGRVYINSHCDGDKSQGSGVPSHNLGRKDRCQKRKQPIQERGGESLEDLPPAKVKKRTRGQRGKKGKGDNRNKAVPKSHQATQAANVAGEHNTDKGQTKTPKGKRLQDRPWQKTPHPKPGTSTKGTPGQWRESLVITSNAGFRTTVKTMTFNRSCHKAQH